MIRIFRRTTERLEIDVDQPESLAIAAMPFEVVHQRPMEITSDVNAVLQGAMEHEEVPTDVIDSLRIVTFSVQRDPITVAQAVLGDYDRKLVALEKKARAPVEAL